MAVDVRRKTSRRRAWALLVTLVVFVVALVLLPAVLIFPFRPQTPLKVALAFEMKRFSPWVTLVALLPIGWLAGRLAGGIRRWWAWAPLGLLVGLSLFSTWFARKNHFEWMFEPIVDPAYASAATAVLGDHDMVIAVELKGDAVAYPVKQMAYHHLLNDMVGGEPVVSTY